MQQAERDNGRLTKKRMTGGMICSSQNYSGKRRWPGRTSTGLNSMGCSRALWALVREDTEDVSAFSVILVLLLLTTLAILIPALAAAHAGHRRGGAFLGV